MSLVKNIGGSKLAFSTSMRMKGWLVDALERTRIEAIGSLPSSSVMKLARAGFLAPMLFRNSSPW
jgi:hypothetical protein